MFRLRRPHSPEAKPLTVGMEGKAVSLRLATGRGVVALVPAASSDAHSAGDVFIFKCVRLSVVTRCQRP